MVGTTTEVSLLPRFAQGWSVGGGSTVIVYLLVVICIINSADISKHILPIYLQGFPLKVMVRQVDETALLL